MPPPPSLSPSLSFPPSVLSLPWLMAYGIQLVLSLVYVPRPFEEEEKGPGSHCVRMRHFPSKSQLGIHIFVLDQRNRPENHLLAAFWAKDACYDQFSYHK